MRKVILLATALSSALALAGCGATQQDRTVGGAAIGAVAGGVLGAAVTGRPGGALAGAAIGAASGAIIGGNTSPRQRQCARVGYDYYGNRVCVAYYE